MPPKRRAKSKPYTLPPASATAREFEQRTADFLREAAFILSEPSESRDQGADFAVWIDEVQHSLGNPLLVEVKAGDLSGPRLEEATSQLRHYVAKTHGRCGLVVYWDRQSRDFPAVRRLAPCLSPEWPHLSSARVSRAPGAGAGPSP